MGPDLVIGHHHQELDGDIQEGKAGEFQGACYVFKDIQHDPDSDKNQRSQDGCARNHFFVACKEQDEAYFHDDDRQQRGIMLENVKRAGQPGSDAVSRIRNFDDDGAVFAVEQPPDGEQQDCDHAVNEDTEPHGHPDAGALKRGKQHTGQQHGSEQLDDDNQQ